MVLCLHEPLEIRNVLHRSFSESSEGPSFESLLVQNYLQADGAWPQEVHQRSLDWWVLSLGNPPSTEQATCCRENLSADVRVLGLAGLEVPSGCVCNLRRPEMTVLRVREIQK